MDDQNDLQDCVIQQIFTSPMPPYKPQDYTGLTERDFHCCIDCGDRFILESSLQTHLSRQSVTITYFCRHCDKKLQFKNRCNLLEHLRKHPESNRNSLYIHINPIPLDKSEHIISEKISNTVDTNPLPASINESSINIEVPKVSSELNKVAVLGGGSKKVQTDPVVEQSTKVEQLNKVVVLGGSSKIVQTDPVVEQGTKVEQLNKVVVLGGGSKKVQIDPVVYEKLLENSLTSNRRESLQITDIKSDEVKVIISEPKKEILANGLVKCRECLLSVEDIQKHFLGENKPADPSIRCQMCDLILPTKCCLKAHLRIHFKKFPYICPDCMKEFAYFELFMVHLRYFCFHLDKCSRFKCEACPGVFPTLTSLEVHLATKHVKPVYKCFACPRAFFEQKLLNDHKLQSHFDARVPTKFFEQCQLCPQKLLTKNSLFLHIHEHVMNKNITYYCYKCSHCQFITDFKINFASHRLTCPLNEKDASAHALAKLAKASLAGDGEQKSFTIQKKPATVSFQVTTTQAPTPSLLKIKESEKKVLSLPSAVNVTQPPMDGNKSKNDLTEIKQMVIFSKERRFPKLTNTKQVYKPCGWHPNKCLMCQNEITLGRPFFRYNCQSSRLGCYKWKTNDSKGADNCVKPNKSSRKFPKLNNLNKKNYMAFNAPSNESKLSCLSSNDSQTYLCHICKHSIQINYTIIQKHFRKQHPEIKLMSVFPLIKKLALPQVSSPIESLTFIVKKSKVYQKISAKEAKLLASRKLNFMERKKLSKSKNSDFQNERASLHWLVCPKCSYKTKNTKTYRKHLCSHKTAPYQCPECSLKFVVEPSLKKHLILHHGNTELNTEVKLEEMSDESNPVNYSDSGSNSSDEKYNCKVCRKSFDNSPDLQKHFRIHGMAFLMSNKDETVWRKI